MSSSVHLHVYYYKSLRIVSQFYKDNIYNWTNKCKAMIVIDKFIVLFSKKKKLTQEWSTQVCIKVYNLCKSL